MRQRWHYIIGSQRDGKLHVGHKRSLFFNSQWYNLSYSDITGSYIKAGAIPRPLSKPFIWQMWRLRKTAQGHSESQLVTQPRALCSKVRLRRLLVLLHLGPEELWRDPELTMVPAAEKLALGSVQIPCVRVALSFSLCVTQARHLIPLSVSSLVQKVRLISPTYLAKASWRVGHLSLS